MTNREYTNVRVSRLGLKYKREFTMLEPMRKDRKRLD